MFFDAQLSVANLEVVSADDHVQIVMDLATVLPTAQGLMPIPIGRVRVPISKKVAHEKAADLSTAADAVHDEPESEKSSGLVVAQSLQGVEQVANMDKKLKGK